MTPAIDLLKNKNILHDVLKYEHEDNYPSFGLEACEKLALSPDRVFKTLVAELDKKQLIIGIIPVNTKLNMKKLAKAAGGKKAVMASPEDVERSTGYVLGGVSPLGQKKALKTIIHDSAKEMNSIYVSAGRRGLEIALPPDALQQLLRASFHPITN